MSNAEVGVAFEKVSFSYRTKSVIDQLSFSVKKGQSLALVGESGSGKTTILRLMNGLLKPQSGQVKIHGKDFDFSRGAKMRRQMGYSIQGSGLFPHMSIGENISLIARKEKWSSQKINARIEELCELVHLPFGKNFLAKRPREISGGQQQRVGIARALFMSPKIMLMDEPFGALDPITREEVQNEFLDLQEKLKLTIVLVTHDLSEAFRMGDEVALLNQGKMEQKGLPSSFLTKPASAYVETFLETHSPGRRLRDIKLYSVASQEVLLTEKKADGFRLRHLESGEAISIAEESQLIREHQLKKQSHIYWVDTSNQLLRYQEIEGNQLGPVLDKTLLSRQDILQGMKVILQLNGSKVPVVNKQNKIVGIFSWGALDAL